MTTWKFFASLTVGTIVSLTLAMFLPVILFGAYVVGGVPFGMYYGLTDTEMILTMIIMAATMIVTTSLLLWLAEWSDARSAARYYATPRV